MPLVSSNASVLRYTSSTRLAQGVGVGCVTLAFGTASLLFSCSSAAAVVVALRSFVFQSRLTSATIAGNVSEGAATNVSFTLGLELSYEGASAAVLTYAVDSDGVYTDVSSFSGLTLSSNNSADLNVSRRAGGGGWSVTVPIGALTQVNGAWITAALRDSGCSLLQTGVGYVHTNLSLVASVVVSAASAKLTVPGESATQPAAERVAHNCTADGDRALF